MPFKLTAGLTRLSGYTNPATGFTHHGFLNIAVATALAARKAPERRSQESCWKADGASLAAGRPLCCDGLGWRATVSVLRHLQHGRTAEAWQPWA